MHSFVTSYIHKTGFPNSTQKIREEVCGACSSAVEAGIPIVMSMCDPNCSVGDYSRSALPGSDIDYWTIIYSGDAILKNIVQKSVQSRISPTMVDVSQPMHIYTLEELTVCANTPYDEVNDRFYKHQSSNDVWAAQAIQQSIEGTCLYKRNEAEPIVDLLSNSKLFKTTPRCENLPKHLKTLIRKRMEHLFPCLSIAEKYALIKLHESRSNELYDRSLKGPNAHVLGRLEELRLLSVIESGNERVYSPLWK